MKKIFWLAITFLFSFAVNAQQIGMYSHYFYKPMVYNPAYTGTGDATNVMFVSRSQWADFKGAPQLNIATIDGNLMNKKVGLGVMLVSDRKGITNRIGGDLSYSYRLKINDDMHLLFGVSLGIVDQTIDYSKALVESANDPTLFSDSERKTVLDGNAGLAFVWKDIEFGAAVPQIFGNKIKYVDNSNVRGNYTQVRHYMGSLKYKYFISKEKGMSITPQGLVRFIPNTPFQYDGNVNFDWQNKFWIGATYKSDYAIGANIGFYIQNQLLVGYSYDFIIGNIGKYSGTSHEIMINFKFGKNKKNEVVVEKPDKNKDLENPAYVKRMDSLQIELKDNQDKLKELTNKLNKQPKNTQVLAKIETKNDVSIQNRLPENSNYEMRIDSLQTTLKENGEKLKELSARLDQLSKKVQPKMISETKNEEPIQNQPDKNTIGVNRMDSLETQFKNNQDKLKELNDKFDQQSKELKTSIQSSVQTSANIQPPVQNEAAVQNKENQNAQMGQNSANKRYENGVLILTSQTNEFKDINAKEPPKGYYVVIGTYYYRDFAMAETQRFVARGYKTADWVYSGPKNFNYIFMFKCITKDEALDKLKIANQAGVKDAWLQELID